MARQFSETSARVSTALERQREGKETPVDLRREIEMWEHKATVADMCKRLGTDSTTGMTASAANARLEADGPNLLTPPKISPWWVKVFSSATHLVRSVRLWSANWLSDFCATLGVHFLSFVLRQLLKQFTNFFAILLIVASVLCFIGYALDSSSSDNLYLGIVLAVVVNITSIFTYFQEAKSDKTMEQFKNFLPPLALVHREGKVSEIDATELVVGDLIDVRLGGKIPADIRIVSNAGLKVDNSSLTGEAEPIGRTIDMTDENPLETHNLAFFGTLAIDGTAVGVVVNTGDRTVFGRIAGLAASGEQQVTTLGREISSFVYIIAFFAISLGYATRRA
jgi:sodium/potassium-transporting ATPase subunit alpha